MVSALAIVGNILFYIGAIGSIISGVRYTHPIITEFYHKAGRCNISQITYSAIWCDCDSMMCNEHSSVPYYCWQIEGYHIGGSNESQVVSQYQTLSPTLSKKSRSQHCFLAFGKREYYRCTSADKHGGALRSNVAEYLPGNLSYLDMYVVTSRSNVDKKQLFNHSDETFPCFMRTAEQVRNSTILQKQEQLVMLAFTPSFVIICLAGLWIVKEHGQGWVKQFGHWFYGELLVFVFSVPFNVVCWIAYLVAMMLCNCFLGRDIGWTWDQYMRNGGVFCLCYMYFKDGECPVRMSCCRHPEADETVQSNSVNSNEGTYNTMAQRTTQTLSDDTTLDLPPSYSDFFQNEAALPAPCELPKYQDLADFDGLPPVYESVVNQGRVNVQHVSSSDSHHDHEVVEVTFSDSDIPSYNEIVAEMNIQNQNNPNNDPEISAEIDNRNSRSTSDTQC